MTKWLDQTRSRQGQAQEFRTLVYGLETHFDNVLLEHGDLPCVLPPAGHLDTFLTLRVNWGFYLTYELPPRPFKTDTGLGLVNLIIFDLTI